MEIALIVVAGCLSLDRARAQTDFLTITQQDNGTTVHVTIEQMFHVRLPVQMGTGYIWQPPDPLPEFLVLTSVDVVGGRSLPGGFQTQVFVLTVKKPGAAQLQFELGAPWDKKAEPIDKFAISVIAK